MAKYEIDVTVFYSVGEIITVEAETEEEATAEGESSSGEE